MMKLKLRSVIGVAFGAAAFLIAGVGAAAAQSAPSFDPPALPRMPEPDLPRAMIPKPLLDPAADGEWVAVCIVELRYLNLGGPYGLTGFGRDAENNYVHFAIGKSGVKMKIGTPTSIAPYVLPASEWFAPQEQPELWSFLREAADEARWVEFWAWAPNSSGLRSVTQVRRAYPGVEAPACPPAS